MSDHPLISIIIATFNADRTLGACLASLRAQTFRNFEIVVADGISRDRTLEILRSAGPEITFLRSGKDTGIYDAWNQVIPRARGEWIYFMGADDMIADPAAFAKSAPYLEAAKENVVYGKVDIILPNGEKLTTEGEPWEKVGAKFRHEMTIPHQGTFQRRSLFEKRGLFDASLRICGDYDFLLRELKDHPAKFMPDVTVGRMAFGGVSSTYQNVSRIIDELALARKRNGLSGFSPYIFMRRVRHALRGLIAKIFGESFSKKVANFYRKLVGKPRLWGRF